MSDWPVIQWRLNPPQLIWGERWIERSVVFDGEIVASSLVDDIENFLKVTEVPVTRSLYSDFCKAIAELGRQSRCNSISTNQQVANVVNMQQTHNFV